MQKKYNSAIMLYQKRNPTDKHFFYFKFGNKN